MKVSNICTAGKSLFEILQQSFAKEDQNSGIKSRKSSKSSGCDASLWSYSHKRSFTQRKNSKFDKRTFDNVTSNLHSPEAKFVSKNIKDFTCKEMNNEKEDFETTKCCYTDFDHEEVKKSRRHKLRKTIQSISEDEDVVTDPQTVTIKDEIEVSQINRMKFHNHSDSPPHKKRSYVVRKLTDYNGKVTSANESNGVRTRSIPSNNSFRYANAKCNIPFFKKEKYRSMKVQGILKDSNQNLNFNGTNQTTQLTSSREISSNESAKKYSKEPSRASSIESAPNLSKQNSRASSNEFREKLSKQLYQVLSNETRYQKTPSVTYSNDNRCGTRTSKLQSEAYSNDNISGTRNSKPLNEANLYDTGSDKKNFLKPPFETHLNENTSETRNLKQPTEANIFETRSGTRNSKPPSETHSSENASRIRNLKLPSETNLRESGTRSSKPPSEVNLPETGSATRNSKPPSETYSNETGSGTRNSKPTSEIILNENGSGTTRTTSNSKLAFEVFINESKSGTRNSKPSSEAYSNEKGYTKDCPKAPYFNKSDGTPNSIASELNQLDDSFYVSNSNNVGRANEMGDTNYQDKTQTSAKFSQIITMASDESDSQTVSTPSSSKKKSDIIAIRPELSVDCRKQLEKERSKVERLRAEKKELQYQLSQIKKQYEFIVPKYNSLVETSKDVLLIDTERKNLNIKNQELEKKVKKLSSIVEDCDTKTSCLEDQLKQIEWERLKMNEEAEKLKFELKHSRQLGQENFCENEKKSEMHKLEQENDLKIRNMHNKIIEMKGNIRVIARFKLESNLAQGDSPTNMEYYHFVGNDSLTLTHKLLESEHNFFLSSRPQRAYTFNRVFRPTAKQEDVFSEVSPYITSCIDGYNVCIMTYGQTGSGKTFTMKGTNKSPGIIPRAVEQIFNECQERKIWKYDLFISILQIYNENMTDLLTNTINRVYIQDDGSTVFIKGLQEFRVRNEEEIKHYIRLGRKRRTTAKTILNFDSSRSHFVVMLRVFGSSLLKKYDTQGILTLCDLAGFERFSASDPYGKQATETKYISKSLTVLARVFEAIRTRKRSIPFRESKLTHLLKPSLSGDAKCVLILTLSPKAENVESSVRSLEFGTKATVTVIGSARKNVALNNEEEEDCTDYDVD